MRKTNAVIAVCLHNCTELWHHGREYTWKLLVRGLNEGTLGVLGTLPGFRKQGVGFTGNSPVSCDIVLMNAFVL